MSTDPRTPLAADVTADPVAAPIDGPSVAHEALRVRWGATVRRVVFACIFLFGIVGGRAIVQTLRGNAPPVPSVAARGDVIVIPDRRSWRQATTREVGIPMGNTASPAQRFVARPRALPKTRAPRWRGRGAR